MLFPHKTPTCGASWPPLKIGGATLFGVGCGCDDPFRGMGLIDPFSRLGDVSPLLRFGKLLAPFSSWGLLVHFSGLGVVSPLWELSICY